MPSDDGLEVVVFQKCVGVVLGVKVRAGAHVVKGPLLAMYIDGVTPEKVAKHALLRDFRKSVDLLDLF